MNGTLGERIVSQLPYSFQKKDVVFSFDRFFTLTKLLSTLPYAAVGTFMKNRRDTPALEVKFKERGELEMSACIDKDLVGIHWKDTKDVYLMTNCNDATTIVVVRKMKDGSKKDVPCPVAINFYNQTMGGVDHANQMITLHELNRKNEMFWRKVFFRELMTAVHNAYIIYCETYHRQFPYISFLSTVSEALVDAGRVNFSRRRSRRVSRPIKMQKVGDHLPIKNKSKRLCCIRCARTHKREKRTIIQCQKCNVALCIDYYTAEPI